MKELKLASCLEISLWKGRVCDGADMSFPVNVCVKSLWYIFRGLIRSISCLLNKKLHASSNVARIKDSILFASSWADEKHAKLSPCLH